MKRIIVEHLEKSYKIYEKPIHRLIEIFTFKQMHKELKVLKGISFSVDAGESIGVIGHNGAGKSTLLKILTGVTQPSGGDFWISGKISALLELGMGFHPDFTGLQNTIMSLQMQGISNRGIQDLIPSISGFAELGDYFYRPVRTYSSGMMVRLGFAVATAIRPDVLIVDEALSVGDAYFQHKCFDRIKEFRASGTTIFFVSHDPGSVKNLCDRAILLENGSLIKEGNPEDILDYYNAIIAKKEADYKIKETIGGGLRSGNGQVLIEGVCLQSNSLETNVVQVGDDMDIVVNIASNSSEIFEDVTVGFVIKDRLGNEIFGTNSFYLNRNIKFTRKGEKHNIIFSLKSNLGIGTYSVTVAVHSGNSHINKNYDWWDHALTFQVIPGKESRFVGVTYIPVSIDVN